MLLMKQEAGKMVNVVNRSSAVALVVFLTAVSATGFIGSMFTFESVKTWYAALNKPPWTPPSWLFGPVWTLLYCAIAVSGWLIWRERAQKKILPVMGIFVLQLFLNGLWSYLFFGLHNPGIAFIDIVGLLLLIALFITLSWNISRIAAILWVPYLCWVGFAAALNYTVWTLN
ncbi:MAG: TspO/MBR family protein [Vulcanimicrobiota bacterium]